MKQKNGPKTGTKLQKLRAKAVRRGEKLANALRKLAAKSDRNDASVAALLKKLEQILPRLHRPSDQHDDLPAKGNQRRVERDPEKAESELAASPKARSRKAKRQPAPTPAAAE